MYVLIACKFKQYLINSNREKVEKNNLSDTQEQLTLWSLVRSGRNSNSSKLYARSYYLKVSKGLDGKKNKKRWKHLLPHYKSMGVFFRRSRADNSKLCGQMWSKFELLLDIMHVLYTYKFKMNQINSNREKVATSIF